MERAKTGPGPAGCQALFRIYLFVVSSFAVASADFLFTLLTMQLTKRCQFNGQIYTMDFPTMTEEQYATALMKCDLGALIQEAFFFLTADEREFIMTGTPPHVWEEMFPPAPEEFIPHRSYFSRNDE